MKFFLFFISLSVLSQYQFNIELHPEGDSDGNLVFTALVWKESLEEQDDIYDFFSKSKDLKKANFAVKNPSILMERPNGNFEVEGSFEVSKNTQIYKLSTDYGTFVHILKMTKVNRYLESGHATLYAVRKNEKISKIILNTEEMKTLYESGKKSGWLREEPVSYERSPYRENQRLAVFSYKGDNFLLSNYVPVNKNMKESFSCTFFLEDNERVDASPKTDTNIYGIR